MSILDNTSLRRCSKCFQEKPSTLEFFYWDKRGNRLYRRCKSCHVKQTTPSAINWNSAHRDRAREHQRQTYLKKGRIRKPLTDAQKHEKRMAAHRWYKANKSQAHANARRSHLRRRSVFGSYTPCDIESIKVAQTDKSGQVRCWYCGKPMQKWHIEHKTPLAKGGENVPENLCLSCAPCNFEKGAKTPAEWIGRLL